MYRTAASARISPRVPERSGLAAGRCANTPILAEVDQAYGAELLASVLDLRENGVATAQGVIRATLDLESARRRVAHHGGRVQACLDSGAAANP